MNEKIKCPICGKEYTWSIHYKGMCQHNSRDFINEIKRLKSEYPHAEIERLKKQLEEKS